MPLHPGDLVDRYRLERQLGAGGFGTVWAARAGSEEAVAIKILHPEHRDSGDQVLRFLREAQVLDSISHRSVVKTIKIGQLPDGSPYLVMEMLDGIDLDQHLRLRGRLDLAQTIAILEPVVEVLELAHARGIVHRDVKASNVFLDRDRVVLLDFGIAKLREGGGIDLTKSRIVLGSLGSSAPEQLTGQPIDARSDVYALGVLAYEMLTGQLPFIHDQFEVMQYLHVHAQRPRVSSVVRVPAAVDDVICRAMCVDPNGRPTAAAFLNDFRSQPAATKPVSKRSPAIGVQLHLHPEGADDDDALDALDRTWDQIRGQLAEVGLLPQIEASQFAMFTSALRDDKHRLALCRAVFDAIHTAKEAKLSAHATVHLDSAILSQDRVVGGSLFDIDAWTPPTRGGEVMATTAAIEGLTLESHPVPGAPGFASVADTPTMAAGGDLKRWMHHAMLARIGRDSAAICHDLRGPLHAITLCLSMLEAELAAVPGSHHESIQDGLSAAAQARALLDSLMSVASRKKFTGVTRPISLKQSITHALKLTRPRIMATGTLELVVPDRDAWVSAAEGPFVLALMNLLHNAADAMPQRGKISVTCTVDDGHAKLVVRDTGTGMPDHVKHRIFEPFYTTKDPEAGTGLGLSIVKDFVQGAGGTISVDSTPGVGTAFTIELPISADQNAGSNV